MPKIAILGGGISGLTTAYELEKARRNGADIDWHLYEAGPHLGGIIQTTRIPTPEGDYILEGGPDGWVTEKPWARDLAIELGLEADLIYSNDATRKTYILKEGQLLPIPDSMRLMVPTDLAALEASPLFSPEAIRAYAAEPTRAAELKASAPAHDESVASFTRRHFGDEVLTTLAAPLLSGVFGGDVHKLSVRSVMPQFVALEREHGSLILALQQAAANRTTPPKPIFTSLRTGIASLTEALIAKLPSDRIHLNSPCFSLKREGKLWCLRYNTPSERGVPGKSKKHFRNVILATSADVTRKLLEPLNSEASTLLPTDASSAILVAFAWPTETASTFTIPQGFGYLVPTENLSSRPERSGAERPAGESPQLLACTFVDQKFPRRAPTGARILRAFFGGPSADALASTTNETIAQAALTQLRSTLGPIPEPPRTTIRRLPRSLPQYEVGHQDRMAKLDSIIATIPNLHLLGNPYRGVGLPDLIRDARSAAQRLA